MPTATRVMMTNTIGLAWRAVQCSVVSCPVADRSMDSSLIGLLRLLLTRSLLARLFDQHFSAILQTETSDRDDVFTGNRSAYELHLVFFSDSDFDLPLVSDGVRADHENGRSSLYAGKKSCQWNHYSLGLSF